jgi:hypothetical protein
MKIQLKKLEDLNNKQKEIKEHLEEIKKMKVASLATSIETVLRNENILNEGDTVKGRYEDSVYIYRTKKEGDRQEDIYQFDYTTSYENHDYDKPIAKVRLGFYSTTCDNDFEYDRMITIGKVAKLVKEQKGLFITIKQNVNDSYKGVIEDLRTQLKDNEADIKYQNEVIDEMEKKFVLDNLTDGIAFDSVEHDRELPALRSRGGDFRNIIFMALVDPINDRKTADLMITCRYKTYSYDYNSKETETIQTKEYKLEKYNKAKLVDQIKGHKTIIQL